MGHLAGKAREIVEWLGKPDCKGSNGWLMERKKRYNIKILKVDGESGDVQGAWKERLPEVIHGYDRRCLEYGWTIVTFFF